MSFRSPLARPNAQESEEDLLKLEQKFQQQKLRSSGLEPDEMGQGEDEDDCNWDTLDRLQHRMLDSSKAAAVAVRTANPPQILKAKSIASSSFGRAGGQAEKIRPAAASTAGAGLGSVRFQEPVVDVPTSAGLQQPSQSSKKKSIFALRKEAAAVAAAAVQQQSTTSSPASSVNNNNNDPSSHRPRNPAPRVFESADHGLGLVLKEVVEKNLNVSSARSPTTQFQDVLTTGFPDVKVRGPIIRLPAAIVTSTSSSSPIITKNEDDNDAVLTAAGGSNIGDIHKENMQTLSSMSLTEIQQAQDEIVSRLDPSLIEMLKRRAQQKYGQQEQHHQVGNNAISSSLPTADGIKSPPASTSSNNNADNTNTTSIPTSPPTTSTYSSSFIPESSEASGKYKHFDVPDWIPENKLEPAKLEWMYSSSNTTGTATPRFSSTNTNNTSITSALESAKSKGGLLDTMRFGFNGLPIPETLDLPSHLGFHHHGEDADRAGYTLKEILMFCRSSVPAQRTVGLSTLASIIRVVRRGGCNADIGGHSCFVTSQQCDEIEYWLSHLNYLLYIRSSLADSHETVFGAGLAALAAALDIPQVLINNKDETDEESCWDFLALTRTGCNRIYALCHETTSAFKFQVRGLQRPPLSSSGGSGHDQDQEPDENSLEYVVNKMKQDGIEALAHTGIIEQLYLSFSRKQQKVGPAATSSSTYGHAAAGGGSADETMKSRYTLLIEILIRLARHSRSFSTLIVQQEGFLDIIVRGCLQISQWPSPEHQQPLPMAIKLLRLLAQSSIKNATAILDAQYLQICGRFLCCTHAELSDHVVVCNTLDLQAEIYLLLNTLFTYKLGAWFADEYRALFLNQIKSFGLVGYPATSPSSTSSFQSLEFYKSKALANLNRMMATMTRLFGQSLHVGSSDDCVRPLIEASLSVATVLAKKDSINKTGTSSNNERQFFTQMAAFTAHCDFVSEYLWQLRASAKGKDGTDNSSNTVAISFAEYLRRATDFGNTWSSSASPLKTAMTALKAMFKEATPSSSSSTYTSSSSFLSLHPTLEPTGMGLRRQNRVSAAARMAFLSMACDVIAARLDIITRCALIHPMAWKGVHEANVIEGGSGWDNNIRQLLFDGIKAGAWGWMYGCLRSDWIRVFTSGWNGLQRAWVEGCGGYMPLPNSTNIRGNSGVGGNLMRLDVTRMRQLVPDIVAVAANLFTDLLPGDEYIASRILHTCLTGESWRRVALGMVEEEGVNTATNSNNSIIVSKRQAAWQFLREYYDSNLWDDASLCMSERLYLVSDAQAKLEEKDGDDEMNELSRENELSLMLDMSSSSGGGSHICLPVPTSWMYSPLEILVDHRNLESTAAANASSVSEEEDEDEGVDRDAIDGGGSSRDEDLCDVDLVSEMLIFTERLSQCGSNSSAASDDGRKWWFLLRHPRELQQQQQSATSELNEFKMASVAGRLYHLLGVYLLLPEASSRENVSRRRRQQQQLSSQEVFSDARISSFMDKYLRENVLSLVEQGVCCVLSSTTSSPNDQLLLQQPHLLFPLLATLMERTAGGQMKLYTAYRQLVSRYQGVSFGNPVFGKLLLLPFIFPAGFASDYRSHFLGEMMDMLRPFDDDVLFGNGGGEEMLSLQKWISLQRIETDKEVQSLYVKVLSGSRSRSHRQGIVGRVALHQVSGFVFDGYSEFEKGSESSGTWSATTKLSAATPSSTPTVSASDGDGDDDAVVVGLKRRMVDALAGNKEIWNAVVGLRDCTRVAEFIKIKLNLVLKD